MQQNKLQLTDAPPRRRFIRRPILLAVSMVLFAATLPAMASSNWWSPTPHLAIGSATINVHNTGALGDGQHDDTAAIQAAINALPSDGGTVQVPVGNYMIDAVKSVSLRSHVRLQLASGARLLAIPNSEARYAVIKVWGVNNVEVAGGEIIGERVRHLGATGEWGQGVNILQSSQVYVHDIKVSQCWGDGFYIGTQASVGKGVIPSDITLNHVTADNNRRQGLSIAPANRVYVVNSVFSNTDGNSPQAKAGIDIEPMTMGKTMYIRIENNLITGNAGNGIEVHDGVDRLMVKNNTIRSNKGFGVYTGSPSNAWFQHNNITANGLQGVYFGHTTNNASLTDNSITSNSTRYVSVGSRSSDPDRDVTVAATTFKMYIARNVLSQ